MYKLLVLFLLACEFVFVFAANVSDEALQSNKPMTAVELVLNLTRSIYGEPRSRHKKWISQLFDEAKNKFDIHPNVSKACRRDYEIFQQHVDNHSVWAIRMLESSEWPTVGIFSGSSVHMGDYSECLKSEAPRFRGRYCLVSGVFRFNLAAGAVNNSGWKNWPDENASVWAVINEYEWNKLRVSRQLLTWAMCMPSSCRVYDLQMSVLRTLRPIMKANGVYGMISVDPLGCKVQGRRQYPQGYYIVRSIFVFLVMLTLSATIYDVFTEKENTKKLKGEFQTPPFTQLLKVFSAKRNCEMLTRSAGNTIEILYMLKIIFIIVVIFGHEVMFSGMFPKTQTEQLELEYSIPWSIESLFNTVLSGFFMISGFLTFYFAPISREETSIVQLIISILFRWLRLVPVMGLVILVFTFILPYMGDGPIWDYTMRDQVNYCKKNWWTNILSVNNFVNEEELCMVHSWYVTVDFQVSIVGSVLLFVLGLHKKVGIFLMIMTFISANVATFRNIYENNVYGVPLYFTSLYSLANNLNFMTKVYIMPYHRVGPYLVGSATALFTKTLKERGYEFSFLQKIFLLTPSFLIGFGAQLYTFVFFMIGRPYDPLENAIFGVLHQILFAIPIAIFICIYMVSGFGALNKIFKFKLYLPLGRLVYCTYLVSIPIQLYYFSGTKRAHTGMKRTDVYWRAVTDAVYSVILAFFFFLISEGPINSMLMLLRRFIIKKLTPKRNTDFCEKMQLPVDVTYKIKNTETVKI